MVFFFFFSSRRRHTRVQGDWSSDVCSSDLFHGPKSAAAEKGVDEAERAFRLVHIREEAVVTVTMRLDVFESNSLVLEQPESEADVTAKNLLRTGSVIGARPADVIVTRREIDHGPPAEDETKGQQSLGSQSVVVIPLAVGPRNGSGRSEAGACHCRPLHGNMAREPPLFGRSEREGGRGDAKDRWSNVIIAAVESPDAPVIISDRVASPVKEAAIHYVLEKVVPVRTGLGGDFEREVIEGPVVVIARFSRETIDVGKIKDRLALLLVGIGGTFVEQKIVVCLDEVRAGAPAQAHEGRGVIARKHGLEAVAKHKATEASRRRYHRGPNLVPEPRMVAAVLQQEARHPKQRFAKDGSCRARRYLIIEGWQVGFPGHFPDKTAHIAIGERLPEGNARRPRKAEHHRALVRMGKLIDVKGVRVENPVLFMQVLPRAVKRRIVDVVRDCDPVIDAERR